MKSSRNSQRGPKGWILKRYTTYSNKTSLRPKEEDISDTSTIGSTSCSPTSNPFSAKKTSINLVPASKDVLCMGNLDSQRRISKTYY